MAPSNDDEEFTWDEEEFTWDEDEDEDDEELDGEEEELDDHFPSPISTVKRGGIDYNARLKGKQIDFGSEIALPENYNIGEKEPLLALATEYSSENTIIQQKIKILDERYEAFRRARRDGNCFFRSFIFSYMEQLTETQDCDEVDRIVSLIEQWNLDNLSCQQSVKVWQDISDFSRVLTFFVREIPEGKLLNRLFTVEDLLARSQDDSETHSMLMFLRMVTSVEILKKAEYYKPFIDQTEHKTLFEYCEAEVTPLGMEAENIHVVALSNALGIAVHVVNLDTSTSSSGTPELNQFDFIPPIYDIVNSSSSAAPQSGSIEESGTSTRKSFSSDQFEVPSVTLLYRPGHYDILYPRTKNKIVAIRPKHKRTAQLSGSPIAFEEDSRKKAREMPTVGEKIHRFFLRPLDNEEEKEEKGQQIVFPDDYNIGEKDSLLALAVDYPSDNYIIREKIELLNGKYGYFRRACRDGNSFYRSFIFSYMEQIIETQNIGEVVRILSCLEQWKLDCRSLGGNEETISYFSSELISLLKEILQGKVFNDIFTVRKLFDKNQNDPETDKMITFLRLVVCVEILKQKDYYKSFFSQMKHNALYEYCKDEVMLKGKEAGHIHATVLSNVFDVPICVESLDMSSSSSGSVGLNHFVFVPQRNDSKDGGVGTNQSSILDQHQVPLVTLLYRPSHYDILYPRASANVLLWPLKQLGILITSTEDYIMKKSRETSTDGNKEPISALASDYPSESNIILEKIKLLDEKYASFRRICGDGNCFYRSFIFSYLEQIVEWQDEDEVSRIFALLEQWKPECVRLGGGTIYNLCLMFASLLREISEGLTVEELLERSRNAYEANAILTLVRLGTSIEICKNEEYYKIFLGEMQHQTIIHYCMKEVVEMGKEANIIHATALVNAFGVPIGVVNLDIGGSDYFLTPRNGCEGSSGVPAPSGSGSNKDGASTSQSSSLTSRHQVPTVTLLYRPGHYDIIYPREKTS